MSIRGFKHIRSRLFFSFLLMALLTIAFLWLIQAGFLRDSYVNSKVRTVEQALESFSVNSIDEIEERTGSSLIVLNNNGRVSYRAQGLPMMGMMQRTAQSMLPLEMTKTQFIDADHITTRYAIVGMPTGNNSTVFAVFSLADADEASRILRQQLWLITITLFIFAAIISAWLAGRLAGPIRDVTQAANKIEQGDYDIKLEVNSGDELGRLTLSLNSMVSQLKRNDQLQKELIANASHELKAPLTIIRGYAETVKDISWENDEKRNAHLDLIIEESDRLKMTVQDILDYSQLQAGTINLKPETIYIMPLLDKILSTLDQYTKQKKLQISVSGSNAVILFDKLRLQQIIINLILNAIQHARIGSLIDIDLQPINQSNEEKLRFKICNEGETIPPDNLNNVWNRYYRSNYTNENNSIGTGLGLAIVKSIMEQHQSAFGVSSQDGKTTFWLDLPVISLVSQPD